MLPGGHFVRGYFVPQFFGGHFVQGALCPGFFVKIVTTVHLLKFVCLLVKLLCSTGEGRPVGDNVVIVFGCVVKLLRILRYISGV